MTETLRAGSHGAMPMVAHTLSSEGADASEDGTGRGTSLVTHSLTTMKTGGTVTEDGTGRGVPLTVGNAMSVRRLTPKECERLQGFPDGWTDNLSDSGRYRCLGNAVAVPVARYIGTQLMAHLKEKVA